MGVSDGGTHPPSVSTLLGAEFAFERVAGELVKPHDARLGDGTVTVGIGSVVVRLTVHTPLVVVGVVVAVAYSWSLSPTRGRCRLLVVAVCRLVVGQRLLADCRRK